MFWDGSGGWSLHLDLRTSLDPEGSWSNFDLLSLSLSLLGDRDRESRRRRLSLESDRSLREDLFCLLRSKDFDLLLDLCLPINLNLKIKLFFNISINLKYYNSQLDYPKSNSFLFKMDQFINILFNPWSAKKNEIKETFFRAWMQSIWGGAGFSKICSYSSLQPLKIFGFLNLLFSLHFFLN